MGELLLWLSYKINPVQNTLKLVGVKSVDMQAISLRRIANICHECIPIFACKVSFLGIACELQSRHDRL